MIILIEVVLLTEHHNSSLSNNLICWISQNSSAQYSRGQTCDTSAPSAFWGLQSTYPFIVNPNLRNPQAQAQAHWLDNKTQLLLFIQPLGLVTNYCPMMENFLSETWSRNTNSSGMYSSFFFFFLLCLMTTIPCSIWSLRW